MAHVYRLTGTAYTEEPRLNVDVVRLARKAGCGDLSHAMTDPAPDMPVTCLIVDDSPQFFEAASQLLADDGITVVGFAATSDQAVRETLALRPDVVLVDVDLGIESGFDVAQRLAGLLQGGPPVVLISAESGTELSELVAASGALGFISKTDLSGDSILELLANTHPEG